MKISRKLTKDFMMAKMVRAGCGRTKVEFYEQMRKDGMNKENNAD